MAQGKSNMDALAAAVPKPAPRPTIAPYDPAYVYQPAPMLRPERRASGLVDSLQFLRFTNYAPQTDRQRRAMELCERFAADFDPDAPNCGVPGLTLYSSPDKCGVGKTHLACAIGNALLSRGYPFVKFCTLKRIMREIKATFGQSGETTRSVVDSYLAPRVILLDDCGKEPTPSEFELSEWFDLVDEWVNRGTRVVRTTNDTQQDSLKKYGHPITSRLKKLCSHTYIEMDGEDYRMRDSEFDHFYGVL